MTASTRRELLSAATSTSTTAIVLIRALTDARPIKPTSTRCLSARRPNPAEAPLIDAEILFRQPQPPQLIASIADIFSFEVGEVGCSRGLDCAVFWLFGNTDIDIAVSGAIGVNCVEKTDPLVCSRSNDTGPVHLRKTFDDLVAFLPMLV